MVDEDEQLRRAVKWRTVHRAERAVGLGDVLSELMVKRISPQQNRAELIADAWSQLLPVEKQIEQGLISADSAIKRFERDAKTSLKGFSSEVQAASRHLEELGRQYPQARIREIKFAVG